VSNPLLQQVQSHQPTCRRGEGFASGVEVDDGTIRGQAIPFGKVVQLAPGLYERFEPAAFDRQIKDPARVKLCMEHGQVIGRVGSLRREPQGLQFEASISASQDIPEARRARALLSDRLVDELSIGFTTVQGGSVVEQQDDGSTLVTHRRARLMEISLVPWGAYGREATLARSVLVDETRLHREQILAHEAAWIATMRL